MSSEKVIEYYNEVEIDYKIIWNLNKNLAIHYGYYDEHHKSHDEAVRNVNHILATMAKITLKDRVLDAGCGVGGSSIWIAQNIGAKVTGLNINENQLKIAKDLAKKNKVDNLITFTKGDFTKTSFPNNYFDVVWILESSCHADNKKALLEEVKRILKKEGRLILADGFLQKENLEREIDKEEMRRWLDGWAVPNLAIVNQFQNSLKDLGFRDIVFKNFKRKVMPSSIRMYRASILLYPIGKILELMHLRTKIQTKNIISAFYQHRTLKKGLWTYGIFYARK